MRAREDVSLFFGQSREHKIMQLVEPVVRDRRG